MQTVSPEDRPRLPPLPPLGSSEPTRFVLVVDNAVGPTALLAQIIARWSVALVEVPSNDDALLRCLEPVDLVILPLPRDTAQAVAHLSRLRALPGLDCVPFLGVVRRGARSCDLRGLDLAGAVLPSADAEHFAFRIAVLLRLEGSAGRAIGNVRVPVDFAVEVEAEGRVTIERAENLSAEGVRLRCSRWLAVNQEVRVRFCLAGQDDEALAVCGRVIHSRPISEGRQHRVGILFFSLDPRERQLLKAEVASVCEAARRFPADTATSSLA